MERSQPRNRSFEPSDTLFPPTNERICSPRFRNCAPGTIFVLVPRPSERRASSSVAISAGYLSLRNASEPRPMKPSRTAM
jgi:hypothetical protein